MYISVLVVIMVYYKKAVRPAVLTAVIVLRLQQQPWDKASLKKVA